MTDGKTTFVDLGLNDQLLKALHDAGYTHPTPIQEQAIPFLLMGRDVVGIAQTGTGKTAGFVLPLLEILKTGKARPRMPRALILAPTRELAAQILESFQAYGKHTNLSAALVVGGDSMPAQTTQLQRGVDVVIATPGRLMDHVQRSGLILTDVKFFIIDEADRMLDMGFIPDIEKIAKMLSKIRQTAMFTATMPPAIRNLATQFLQTPKEITVARTSSTNANITQEFFATSSKDKLRDLYNLIADLQPTSLLIFCNRKIDVDHVKRYLSRGHINVTAIHGDMMQSKRYESLEAFKSGQSKIIVCSDVAARGIDIDDVSHVINFNVPNNAEDYVHRIGRTGRAGKTGHAVTFVTEDDQKSWDAVEKLIQTKIPQRKSQKPAKVETPQQAPRPPQQQQAPAPKPPAAAATTPAPAPAAAPRPAAAPIAKEKEAPSADPAAPTSPGFGTDLPDFMRNGGF